MRNRSKAFLENIVQDLLKKDGSDFSDTCILLPTKRSVLYMKAYFSESERSIILPEIFTFDEFVASTRFFKTINQEDSLIYLHKAYTEIKSKFDFPFTDFINNSIYFLKDFNDIDQNLVNTNDLFDSLGARSALERWSNDFEDLSFNEDGMISDYFTFWEISKEVYLNFHKLLIKNNLAYPGLVNRDFAENIDIYSKTWKYKIFIIAGFNYLSRSQSKTFAYLNKNFQTRFFWDIDSYFYDRKYHEAGKYMRLASELDITSSVKEYLNKEQFPEVKIHSCPNKNSQVKYGIDELIDLLQSLDYERDVKNNRNLIALIPADESLLKILLESLPNTFIDKNNKEIELAPLLNISMGRSLKDSSFFSLFKSIFDLNDAILKNGKQIYYPLVKTILLHPLIKSSLQNFHSVSQFDAKIRKSNRAFVNIDDVLKIEKNEVLENIFKNWGESASNFPDYISTLISSILSKSHFLEEDEKIFLNSYLGVFDKIKGLLIELSKELDSKSFRKLIFQLLGQFSIPFSGEPISPIQIMGLLETRALDFDHVFILSCNEGELPKSRSYDSLLPFEIRKHFGLPTFIDKDASLSYTFYRLFFRAQFVHLFYHNASAAMSGKASKSRFLRQLEMELLPDFDVSPKIELVRHYFPTIENESPGIEKTEDICQSLVAYLEGGESNGKKFGLSPSKFNTYCKSPLVFFERAILRIKESDVLEEDFAANTFGSIIHEVLEIIFTPFIGSEINKNSIDSILANTNLEILLKTKTKELYGDIEIEKGLNRLYLYSANQLIKKYLKVLSEDVSFRLLALEENLVYTYTFYHDTLNRNINVTISGLADRIDFVDNRVRILDYKTGSIDDKGFKFDSTAELWEDPKRDKIVQLLLYKYVLLKSASNYKFMRGLEQMEVESGFYFFKKGEKAFMQLKASPDIESNEDFCATVELIIQKTVTHMLDKKIPFTKEIKDCIW